MKLQHLAVLFIIIIVPISLVLSEYLHIHIQTIQMQTDYTTRLINATYDGVKAFQLNTQHNSYSTIGNSKIRDIEASINTFYNSLGTAMGASGYNSDDMKTFTPAILTTLYDGYYIYTKYYDTEQKDYTYGLKPFISYSCRYVKGSDYNFVVNYTLDNTITVIGTVKGQYVTKTGHLIPQNEGESSLEDGESLRENLIILNDDGQPEKGNYQYIIYHNQKVYEDDVNNPNPAKRYFYYSSEYKKDYVNSPEDINNIEATQFKSKSANEYYNEANDFTTWVNTNLADITVDNAVDMYGNAITDFATNLSGQHIFNINSSNNPLKSDSVFNEHRMNAIRKSIETNLIAAIANYNDLSDKGYEFAMPKLSEDDWNKIENSVCMVSFLQGMPIKTRIYNNYCVVSNNTNQETVGENSIYILDSNGEYHKPGCKKLIDELNKGQVQIVGAYSSSDFERKNVPLTGEDANAYKQLEDGADNSTAYFYPQEGTACYDCIVNASDTYSTDDIINGIVQIKDDDGNVINTVTIPQKLRETYFTALARIRYDLYRVNSYFGI